MSQPTLAERFHQDVHAAGRANLSAEPEAQLTTPVSNLFRAVIAEAGLGEATFVREQRTGRTRPDFGVLHRKAGAVRQFQRGYVELKAPSVSVDTSTWKGKDRNVAQWRQMAIEAEVLIVCNGRQARLYVEGNQDGLDADLPYDNPAAWDRKPLENLLRRFLHSAVSPVKSIGELATRLAHRTADLRDRLLWLLEQPSEAGELARAQHEAWRQAIHAESSGRDFADGISQVVSYGMVLAALSGREVDVDQDKTITVQEARAVLGSISPVMAAAFAPLLVEPLFTAVQVEVGHLEVLISGIDVARVTASADVRGEPWLYFYEDFLGVYDPAERKQAGVYYTPTAVVRAMVAMVDHILVERFGLRAGFADPAVVTLDPAVGTGTFPLAVLDRAAQRMEALRGPAGRAQVAKNLSENLIGFELLPGPYAVAHLRLTQRLQQLDPEDRHSAKVLLTDTLESPEGIQQGQLPLFGEARVLAMEQNRAKKIKAEQRVTVVIGNPPYRRLAKDVKGRGAGGWMFEPFKRSRTRTASLFDDMLDVAREHTIFSHHASLYNLYVYFWRWAIWKAFEAHGDGPAVVAFITGSSWLTGPGFMGLRQIVRQACDEAWVVDLGGDNKGTNPEENVFAIETPVAVVVLVRNGTKEPKRMAEVRYRKIDGTREEKLAAMEAIAVASDPLATAWESTPREMRGRMVPGTGNDNWEGYPLFADLLPFQQPGMMWNRTWPISADAKTLQPRWRRFLSGGPQEREDLYSTPPTGRNIHTRVAGLAPLASLVDGTGSPPVVRYPTRSFDRQWAFSDPRLCALERPALQSCASTRQLYLVSLMTAPMSSGPCITVAADVPDKHYFNGRGGKDVLPLYRDAAATQPNVTRGLLSAIGKAHGTGAPTPEDLAAYVYALLSAPAYQVRFAGPLQTPGPRVPMTADLALWREAVDLGTWLLWLQTYAERLQGPGRGRFVPAVLGLVWTTPVRIMPETTTGVAYDPLSQTLRVGDGVVAGVRPDVWEFSVSGWPVVKKWLGYRTAKGAGRAASSKNPLDRIRPDTWPDEWNDELLDLLRVLTLSIEKHAQQADLLDRICAGPLIAAADLPKPDDTEREPPARD